MNLLAPFVPETVHDAVAIIFDAHEVRAKVPFEMQAYEDWLAKIREIERGLGPVFRHKSHGRYRLAIAWAVLTANVNRFNARVAATMRDIQGYPTQMRGARS